MVLSVTDLSCARGAAQVLAGVSFSVSPGEALILRGPNGAGKTTLLRTLAGLTPPLAGVIDCAPDAIAYAAHADGLKAQLTVAENLDLLGRGLRIRRHRPRARRLRPSRPGPPARG
jgi:heme exporter protein A